jgi:hypothetical protein
VLDRHHRAAHAAPLILVGMLLGACIGAPRPPVPANASPREVLEAYLRALQTGDCGTGRTLTVSPFGRGNGELCDDTRVASAAIDGDPATPKADEAVFATTLVTTGTGDGSVHPGEITWFFDLRRQQSGAWRLAGGGSGP